MDLDALKVLFEDFDLAAFLPDLSGIQGWIETVLRVAVMAGPILLLGFGLLYLMAPPKEANHSFGYRFWWGMASLKAWQFTQKVAGFAWTGLGIGLTIVMAVCCNAFRRMEMDTMTWFAGKCLLWELGLIALSCLVIDIIVIACFDRQGYRRGSDE